MVRFVKMTFFKWASALYLSASAGDRWFRACGTCIRKFNIDAYGNDVYIHFMSREFLLVSNKQNSFQR